MNTTSPLQRTSFCTSSFINNKWSKRRRIVSKAIKTWSPILLMDLSERIFLDDRSPRLESTQNLKESGMMKHFDKINYHPRPHYPHSNFGILASFDLCNEEYILHLDDDVFVRNESEAPEYINYILKILEEDKSILGVSFNTQTSITHSEWTPDRPYTGDPMALFAHPKKYFGTAACLIRRSLVNRLPLHQIEEWGADQPANWEQLISNDPSEFLVNTGPTPFAVEEEAWTHRATYRYSLRASALRPFRTLKNMARGLLKANA